MLPTFGFFELPAINIIFDRFQVHKSSVGVQRSAQVVPQRDIYSLVV